MFNLVIVPSNSQNFGVGHFKTLDAVKSAQANIHERLKLAASEENLISVSLVDDFGTILDIPADNISYTVIIDVKGKSLATIEAKFAEARANMEWQQRMSTDRELQVLSRFVSQPPQPQVVQVPSNTTNGAAAPTPQQPN